MERVLGYSPGVATERLRVAEALVELPRIATALYEGRMSYSTVRELSRVVVPETEAVWLAAARDRTVRDVEAMVSGRKPGDLPNAPRTPAETLGLRMLKLDVSDETLALFTQASRILEDEHGERLDSDALLAALSRAVIDGGHRSEAPKKAPHQIMLTVCERCDRGWQDAAGKSFEVTPSVVERARCDAQHLDLEGRTKTDISASKREKIWRRDRGRCRVPGCRSTRHLDVHHIKLRSEGGDHALDNLCLLCSAHHAALHDGKLIINGTASTNLTFLHADGRPYGTPPPSAMADDVRVALRSMGFTPGEARAAVDAALPHVGAGASVESLLREALRALRTAKGGG
jgi:hypothetical protein